MLLFFYFLISYNLYKRAKKNTDPKAAAARTWPNPGPAPGTPKIHTKEQFFLYKRAIFYTKEQFFIGENTRKT